MLHMRDQIQACPMFLTPIPALEAPKPESVSLSQGEATTPTELNSGAWRRSAMTWRLRRILCEWMWSTLKAKSPFHYIMLASLQGMILANAFAILRVELTLGCGCVLCACEDIRQKRRKWWIWVFPTVKPWANLHQPCAQLWVSFLSPASLSDRSIDINWLRPFPIWGSVPSCTAIELQFRRGFTSGMRRCRKLGPRWRLQGREARRSKKIQGLCAEICWIYINLSSILHMIRFWAAVLSQDATMALRLCPSYGKARFRRGILYMELATWLWLSEPHLLSLGNALCTEDLVFIYELMIFAGVCVIDAFWSSRNPRSCLMLCLCAVHRPSHPSKWKAKFKFLCWMLI